MAHSDAQGAAPAKFSVSTWKNPMIVIPIAKANPTFHD
jgi:hypothetical protein